MAGRVAYYGGIVKDGLVLDLDAAKKESYPGSGTRWNDIAGGVITGSLTNGPTFDGNNGGSIVFDGTNDYVEITGIQSPSFSISTWIKLSELNRFHGIMGRASSIWSNTSYAFRVISDNRLNILLSNNGNTGVFTEVQTSPLLSINTWYHAVITFAKPNIVLYVNGSSQATGTFNYDLFNSTSNSIIGGYAYGNGLDYLMKGSISNIQFYNRALSAAEITQNYNALKGRYGL